MDKSLKPSVLIVHNFYQEPGGEDTVVINEKQLLESYGHRVILYTRNNSELKNLSFLKKIILPFITIYNIKTYNDIKKIIREYHIEIIHVHNTLCLISPSVYYAAMSCKIPIVQTMHNFRMLCPGATFYRDNHICEDCVKNNLMCAIKHKCYRESRLQTFICVLNLLFHRYTKIYHKLHYICLTDFNRKKLLQLNLYQQCDHIDPQKVYIKPNFTFDFPKLEREEGDYFLFIGRVEKLKGIDILLEAFRTMPKHKLIIVGTGSKLEYYQSLASKNVEFKGQLEKKELAITINKSKAVIVSSQCYESFGMVIIEAYAAHKAVIAGNIGNIASLVKDNITGIKFTYNSPASLKDAILKFEQNNKSFLEQNCYKEFKNKYSPDNNYKILEHIYNRLL